MKTTTDVEAERGLIGAILALPRAIGEVADSLLPEHLWEEPHRQMYAACLDLYAEHGAVTAERALREIPARKMSQGIAYFTGLMASHTYDPKAAAEHLILLANKRRIIAACRSAIHRLEDPADDGNPVDDLTAAIIASAHGVDRTRARTAKEIVVDWLSATEERIKRQREGKGAAAPYGIACIDEATGGKHPGHYVVIGARPGGGKSALITTMLRADARAGRCSALYSFEMDGQTTAGRLISQESGVPFRDAIQGSVSSTQMGDIFGAVERAVEWPVIYRQMTGSTPAQIERAARADMARYGITCVYVDYLQLIEGSRGLKRFDVVSDASRGLANMARRLGLPVIAAAQLKRDAANREPGLEDLKESGQIEQDADLVLFPWVDNNEEWHIKVAKNRHGEGGSKRVTWRASTMEFVDIPYSNREGDHAPF